jgi:hypothetical protein
LEAETREMAEKVGILVGSYHTILVKNLKIHHMCHHTTKTAVGETIWQLCVCIIGDFISAPDSDLNVLQRMSQVMKSVPPPLSDPQSE